MAYRAFLRKLSPAWPRLILAAVLTALLTACASPIVARVTSFNQWPADLAGSTFSFITPVDPTRVLEQATYEGYVQAELEKIGLKRAATGQAARILVDVAATSQSGEKTYLQPVYRDTYVFVPPFRDAAGRVFPGGWSIDPFGPRYVGDQELHIMTYTHSLRVRLLDAHVGPRGQTRTLFEASAIYTGDKPDLPVLLPYLVRAIFEDFPGRNGQVRSVKFDGKTGALIKK